MPKGKEPLISYLSFKCYGAPAEQLKSVELFRTFLYEAARRCNSEPRQFFYYQFPEGGQGITTVLVVSESYLVAETWPEFNYFDVTARLCGKAQIEKLKEVIEKFFPKLKKKEAYVEQKKG